MVSMGCGGHSRSHNKSVFPHTRIKTRKHYFSPTALRHIHISKILVTHENKTGGLVNRRWRVQGEGRDGGGGLSVAFIFSSTH